MSRFLPFPDYLPDRCRRASQEFALFVGEHEAPLSENPPDAFIADVRDPHDRLKRRIAQPSGQDAEKRSWCDARRLRYGALFQAGAHDRRAQAIPPIRRYGHLRRYCALQRNHASVARLKFGERRAYVSSCFVVMAAVRNRSSSRSTVHGEAWCCLSFASFTISCSARIMNVGSLTVSLRYGGRNGGGAFLSMVGWIVFRSMVRVQVDATATGTEPGRAEIRRSDPPLPEGTRAESGSARRGRKPDSGLSRLHRTRRERADVDGDPEDSASARRGRVGPVARVHAGGAEANETIGARNAYEERAVRIRELRSDGEQSPVCSEVRDYQAGAGVQGARERESSKARAETESQAELAQRRRFPRPCRRLVDRFRFSHLAGEFSIGKSLPGDLRNDGAKTVPVVHLFTVVVTERLFIDVAEQVIGLDAHVSSVQSALQQCPKVLNGVGVSIPVHILNGVVDDVVPIIGAESFIGREFIREDRRASFHALTDVLLKFFAAASI